MENNDTLDIRYLEKQDQLIIFYNCNYGSYYGCPSDDGHYIIYRDMEDDRIVGIEIFNFEQIIKLDNKTSDIVIKYYEHMDTLSIFKENPWGAKFHKRLNDHPEKHNASVIWYDKNDKIVEVDIHKFKEKVREF